MKASDIEQGTKENGADTSNRAALLRCSGYSFAGLPRLSASASPGHEYTRIAPIAKKNRTTTSIRHPMPTGSGLSLE